MRFTCLSTEFGIYDLATGWIDIYFSPISKLDFQDCYATFVLEFHLAHRTTTAICDCGLGSLFGAHWKACRAIGKYSTTLCIDIDRALVKCNLIGWCALVAHQFCRFCEPGTRSQFKRDCFRL